MTRPRAGRPAPEQPTRAGCLRAACETVALFGLLGWLYVGVVAAADIERLDERLIHAVPLRIDTAGAICFILSVAAFLVLDTRRDRCGRSSPLRRGGRR
jgi:hypothetical protein